VTKLTITIDDEMKVFIALKKADRNAWVTNKQWRKDTELSPEHLNDAVELLESKGLVEWLQSLSKCTAPFKFDCAQLTALGRSRIK
jgi:hypothetical protein